MEDDRNNSIPRFTITHERRGTLHELEVDTTHESLIPSVVPVGSDTPATETPATDTPDTDQLGLAARAVDLPTHANVNTIPIAPDGKEKRGRRKSFLKDVQGFFQSLGRSKERSKSGEPPSRKSSIGSFSSSSSAQPSAPLTRSQTLEAPRHYSETPTSTQSEHPATLPHAHRSSTVDFIPTSILGPPKSVGGLGLPLRKVQTMPAPQDDNSSISSASSDSRGRWEEKFKKVKSRRFSLSPRKVEEGMGEEFRRFKSQDERPTRQRSNSVFSSLFGSEKRPASIEEEGDKQSWWKRRFSTGNSVKSKKSLDAEIWVEPPLPPIDLRGREDKTVPVLDQETASEIRKSLPPRMRDAVSWTLLYSLNQHGVSMSTMYYNVTEKGPSILGLQDEDGCVFGAFLSEPIFQQKEGKGYYGTGEMFLWEKFDPIVVETPCLPEARVTFAEPGTVSRRISQGSIVQHDSDDESIESLALQLAQSILSNPAPSPRVVIHKATLVNDYFVATRYDSVIFGGDENGHVALEFSRDLYNASSDGQCPTFDLTCPLTCRIEGEHEHTRFKRIKIVGLEFWNIDFDGSRGPERRKTKAEILEELGLDGRSRFAKEL
jgi:hypothetical protein